MSDNEKPGKWKKLETWLFDQGVSTVLLFGVLAAVSYVIVFLGPQIVGQIQHGYERIEASQDKQTERIAKSFDADQERDDRRYADLLHDKLRGEIERAPARPIARKKPVELTAPL